MMKCVIIVDSDMPAGLIANTTAALGISLGSHVEGLIGEDLKDASQRKHPGITNIPIPILVMDRESLTALHDDLKDKDEEDMTVIGFSQVAQRTHSYNDYARKLSESAPEDIEILGLCLYGKRTRINKLTGNLRMLR